MKSPTLLFLIIAVVVIIALFIYFDVNKLFIAIGVIILIILIVSYFSKDNTVLSNLNNADKTTIIKADKLKAKKNSSNYSYSIWFYVNDWEENLGKKKVLLSRTKSSSESDADDGKIHNPEIYFSPYENNINVNITTFQKKDSEQVCSITNFPIQSWVNLLVSVNGRTVDVYLDGKLVRTCLLPNIPKSVIDADLYITPNGGFSGWTSKARYFNTALNPQQAYNIYKGGLGRGFSDFFSKYKFKFSYLVNNVEQGSIEI